MSFSLLEKSKMTSPCIVYINIRVVVVRRSTQVSAFFFFFSSEISGHPLASGGWEHMRLKN